MPGRETIGERVAGLNARFDVFEKYTHERWHRLNNDLSPLMQLPERMTRDIGKTSKEIERSITVAIEKAMLPIIADVAELKCDVEILKTKSTQLTGAKMVVVFIIQTIIAAATAVGGVLALGRHP